MCMSAANTPTVRPARSSTGDAFTGVAGSNRPHKGTSWPSAPLLTTFAGMALALFAWAMSTGFWPLAGFALVFGTSYGGWVALLPAVVMDYFGGRNVSDLIGILYTSAPSAL